MRCSALLGLVCLSGCQSEDYKASGIAQGVKGSLDSVNALIGQPVGRAVPDPVQGEFPAIPADPRPLPRSAKQRNDMIALLNSDHDTAAKIGGALAKSEPTHYLVLNGGPPAAPPIQLISEAVILPNSVRDIDSYDPSHAGSWFELASIDFPEGSAELPEDSALPIAKAARLVTSEERGAPTMRVVGYSGSERVRLAEKGPHEANRFLADLRARRVAEKLIEKGAAARQILVGPAPEAERAKGEKVEIIIDY